MWKSRTNLTWRTKHRQATYWSRSSGFNFILIIRYAFLFRYFYNEFHIKHAFCTNAACMHFTNKQDVGFSPTFAKASMILPIVFASLGRNHQCDYNLICVDSHRFTRSSDYLLAEGNDEDSAIVSERIQEAEASLLRETIGQICRRIQGQFRSFRFLISK